MAEDTTNTQPTASKEDVEKNKTNAVLSYIGILILVPLLSEDAKKSPYAKFHMNQGLVITLVWIVASFVIWVPIIGWVLGIAMFVLWIIGLMGAINGEMKRVPLLGNIELIK